MFHTTKFPVTRMTWSERIRQDTKRQIMEKLRKIILKTFKSLAAIMSTVQAKP